MVERLVDDPGSCKGCSADVNVSEKQIRRMLEVMAMKEFACVSEAVYQDRLQQCAHCPSLQYGTTCAHCGCIVRVRAKLAEKHCPLPGNRKW
ncbi:hypothetical protein SAMN02799630_03920 [Paenibacillus sp. UNCCL117]|uniref:DUF6171 family protein n=1 Tax=unclassified Paenibacillus TaxID=185978 RepID=UPI00088DEED9|nr:MULTISPECIES: DUF6171 family protein [unclassified Paenibacillus]SDD55549.1 hypothetical protein SAMN04488602_11015 [Paenibacillus sp. cl123]SFW51564.1 hypothetical protein SAMN02799630_03920 [Paenibacillus sp. UNCCL117]